MKTDFRVRNHSRRPGRKSIEVILDGRVVARVYVLESELAVHIMAEDYLLQVSDVTAETKGINAVLVRLKKGDPSSNNASAIKAG